MYRCASRKNSKMDKKAFYGVGTKRRLTVLTLNGFFELDSSRDGRSYLRLSRLLRNLIVGTVAVSSTCCLQSFFKRDPTCCRYKAVVDYDV